MASLVSQYESAAIYYAVLGKNASVSTIDYFAQQLQLGNRTDLQFINGLLASADGVARFGAKTPTEILQTIYTNIHGVAATPDAIAALLATGDSVGTIVNGLINGLTGYLGSDSITLTQQTYFDTKIKAALFPSSSVGSAGTGASDVAAIYHVLGAGLSTSGLNYWGGVLNAGTTTIDKVAQAFVNDRSYLTSLSNEDFVARIFQYGFERAPSSAEASSYLALLEGGATRGSIVVDIIESLRGGVAPTDATAQAHFNAITSVYTPGQLPALNIQEQVAAIYLGVPGRGIDAQALDTWGKIFASGSLTSTALTAKLLSSPEFQQKGGQLTGDAFIQHVYTLVHGVAATAGQLATYSALGSDKSLITQAIINDLRTSTATDAATVTQQHGFEFDIGTSLLYKTAASLTATAAGGNATGTVNTGASHQISNAETAVLTNVQLNANAASVVNLKFADHLANLTINGSSAATVNLSDNGVNPGVDITVNNGNVILNASSGADDVLVTAAANVGLAASAAKFNLGEGNDSLKWLGNAAVGGANTVSANIQGNGGNGVDTISANFITKNVVMSGNAIVRTATITSNASQFTNFEKIDLAGYIGKATVNTGSTAANHTFDFGLLTGNAVSESSTTGLTNNVVQAATSTIGSQGFVLSGLAEAVKVINAAGGNSAQLEVTGNATAASSVEITFLQNATNHFNVTFDAVSSTDVNAGSLALNSSSSVLLPTVLSTLNIASGGTGNFDNILSLTGTNAQVQNIAITGDHVLDLTVGSGFSNVRDINATANTAGLNLDSSHAGTGDGIIVQLLNILPLSAVTTALLAPVLTTLGLNGYQLTVEGTGAADSFNVLGNTTLAGGNGVNTYDLKSSTTQAGVTITDFDSTKDKIVDAASALTISGNTSGTAVADYGTRASDTLDALLGTLVGGLTNGVIGLLGGILGLGSSNALTAKVGVASVVFGGSGDNASSYVIIDNNNNHTLDTSDSVVYLTGQNHQQLLDTLHYA
ncbi:beta strand repeat-containing protein [Serratia proteamaculans]|uniref:beta strand repeat-containing protein n=1 Tax=Serratia proteamaculans TaxID=28151 RepID=UPI003CE9F9DF